MALVPEMGALGFDARGGGAFAEQQAGVLVGAQEPPELGIVVARQALQPASQVTPEHCDAADQRRMRRQAIDRHRQIIERRGAHEILAEAGAQPSGPDALVAGALRTQMNEANGLEVDALGDPAEHARAVAVDAVPHHLAHEAADFLEARDPIELGHADRHLVAADLGHQRAVLRMHEPRLARRRADARIALHPLHQDFEVADRQVEIHVELAEVVEVLEVDLVQARIEGFDDAGADLAAATVGAP